MSQIGRRGFLSGLAITVGGLRHSGAAQAPAARTAAIDGGRWWSGTAFVAQRMFMVDGRLSRTEPAGIGTRIDLTGAFVVPPYGDAHNHGIGTGDVVRDQEMVDRYRREGVLYMQSLGNLPLSRTERDRLGLDGRSGVDAVLAQGSITGPGGHPMGIIRDRLLPAGYFPGETLATLRDRRFHEVATEAELRARWPLIRRSGGDIIKFFLYNSGSYAARRDDPAFFGRRGLDPRLAAVVVELGHAERLRVAAHVVDIDDYRTAVDCGVDIIGHVPTQGLVTAEDARRTAERGIRVVTTCAFLARLAGDARSQVIERQRVSLTRLREAGVLLAIGTDDPADTGLGEIQHLASLGVFSASELLNLWTGATGRAIFPQRRVGAFDDGCEASFLALDANPLDDWSNARRIRVRYRQGVLLPA